MRRTACCDDGTRPRRATRHHNASGYLSRRRRRSPTVAQTACPTQSASTTYVRLPRAQPAHEETRNGVASDRAEGRRRRCEEAAPLPRRKRGPGRVGWHFLGHLSSFWRRRSTPYRAAYYGVHVLSSLGHILLSPSLVVCLSCLRWLLGKISRLGVCAPGRMPDHTCRTTGLTVASFLVVSGEGARGRSSNAQFYVSIFSCFCSCVLPEHNQYGVLGRAKREPATPSSTTMCTYRSSALPSARRHLFARRRYTAICHPDTLPFLPRLPW